MNKIKNTHCGLEFSTNPEGEVRTDGKGQYFDRVNPDRCFLILSTAIKAKSSMLMNSLLYTSKARGKYILKNTSCLFSLLLPGLEPRQPQCQHGVQCLNNVYFSVPSISVSSHINHPCTVNRYCSVRLLQRSQTILLLFVRLK